MNRKKKGDLLAKVALKNMNSDKSLIHKQYTTGARNAQFKSLPVTRIFTGTNADRGKARCYHCLIWVPELGAWAVRQIGFTQYAVGICQDCFTSLPTMPEFLQKDFWQKVERNLKNTLEVEI
jgi:hypothetical protein